MTILRKTMLACAALATLGLGARAQEAPPLMEPVGVQLATAQVRVDDMYKLMVYDGTIVPHVEELSFTVDGEIDEILAIAGQTVKKGDLLMTLNRESQEKRREALEIQLDALKSQEAYAQALNRIDLEIMELELEGLLSATPKDETAIALKRLDMEEFELEAKLESELRRIEMDAIREELDKIQAESGSASLIAPCDGRVMFIKNFNGGDRVNAYAPILYLADDSRLALESEYVSQANVDLAWDVYALIHGQRWEIEYVPGDTKEFLSRALAGDALTARFTLNNTDGLAAGDYAAVCLENSMIQDALVIPRNSLYTDASGKYVYVVEDGARVRRSVETGLTTEWQIQIKDGLQEGEIVYVQD